MGTMGALPLSCAVRKLLDGTHEIDEDFRAKNQTYL